MFSCLKKIVSVVTLITALVVAVRELKAAVDSLRNHSRCKDHTAA
jgi:hypothetical protein